MKRLLYITLSLVLFTFLLSACEKFIEVDSPKTRVLTPTVFASDATATAAVAGIYSRMSASSYFLSGGEWSINGLAGTSADEFTFHSSEESVEFFSNSVSPANSLLTNGWLEGYQYIYTSNSILEGLANSSGVTASTKKQLEGEAKFIRGLCYLYLTSLFGDVPLHLTTDYRINTVAFKTPQAEVYQQVITDLKDAQALLNENYVTSSNDPTSVDRVRPNKWAATALLARVYLYVKDWAKAEAEATAVLNQTSKYNLVLDLNAAFLKESKEAIWQLMPVIPGQNTNEGFYFILAYVPYAFVSLTDQLVDSSFEPDDLRKTAWIGSFTDPESSETYHFPYKYKINGDATVTEYSIVLRLAEQFLIRSEARAEQNKVSEARADLNAIRSRAGLLPNTTASNKASLLSAIEQERKVELFTEGGHRWLDLKRWGRANAVLGPQKAPDWQTTDQLYPIPQAEIINNPNITQNPGY